MVAWARTGDDYVLPSIGISVAGTGWLTGAAVGSWTLDRELVSSTIPGNIRERNGLSIGAASVNVRPLVRATPWSTVAATKVESGLPATLYAQASDGTTKQLGAWVTDETDGSISSEAVDVDLLEASFVGRDLPQTLPAYEHPPFDPEMPVDPVWTIARLLEQAGFPSVPRPNPATTLLAIPMDGAIHASMQPPSGGNYTTSGLVQDGWQNLGADGPIAGGSGSWVRAIATASAGGTPTISRLRSGQPIYFTLDVVGTVHILDFAQEFLLEITNNGTTASVFVSNTLGVGSTIVTFPAGQSADWPNRVQIEFKRVAANPFGVVGGGLEWDSATVRGRSSSSAAWSSTRTNTVNNPPAGGDGIEMLQVVGGVAVPDVPGIGASPPPGQFASVAISTDPDDPLLWTPRRAILKPLGGDSGLPFIPEGIDTWQAVQDVASANLGAVIIDLDGMARVLDKDDLAGVGSVGDPIDVGAEWEDLGWTLDPEDSADRLEVSYTPPSIANSDPGSTTLAPVAWDAEDIVRVNAGETLTLPVTFSNRAAVGVLGTFIVPDGSPSPWWSQASSIVAFDNPDAVGLPIAGTLLQASATQTSATTAVIKVRNEHTVPIYLVDGNGDPCLILRARTVATFETAQMLSRGASAEDAERPLAVNLTPWAQSQQQAELISNYLWDRISGGALWKASSVRCRLDWSLDIGQVRPIAHPRTGLAANVLITKVHYDGDDGQIAQSLDLVLIPWTYADFAETWPTQTYAQFAIAQGSRTYADFAADPLWTGA